MARPGRKIRTANELTWAGWPYLIISAICLLSGVLIGFALAYWGEHSSELCEYLRDYLNLSAGGNLKFSFFSVFWDCVRWPILAIVLGFTALGVIGIPALLLIRGFLLAYTVTCFSVFFGLDGLAAAGVLLSVAVILVLPVLLVLCCEGLRAACGRLPGAVSGGERRCRAEIILPGVGISVIAASLQWTVVPLIFAAVCARLLI